MTDYDIQPFYGAAWTRSSHLYNAYNKMVNHTNKPK